MTMLGLGVLEPQLLTILWVMICNANKEGLGLKLFPALELSFSANMSQS